jgi:hypothetical protein
MEAVQQPTPPKDLTEVATHLSAIQSAIAKLSEKAEKKDYMSVILPFVGGVLGVLIGGGITYHTQKTLAEKAAKHAKELADDRAKLEIGNSFVVQWQLKQLSELYGPLHALFRQSNALYRHMNTVLGKADPDQFRLVEGSPGDDFDNMVFQIKLKGQWGRFRTIMHIDKVYGQNYGIEDYFDEVVSIGGRIVKVITENAGYVRADQSELAAVFGKYLAHYSVLERLHSHMKARRDAKAHDQTSETIKVDESAVFPLEIQRLVDAGFGAITRELNEWRARAAA